MARKTPIPPEVLERVGKDLILSSRHGVLYVKRYARPKNPDTPAQKRTRTALARAVHAWQSAGIAVRERWNRTAKAQNMTGYNLFIREFMARDGAVPD
ncbi:MAG TPA: hypothetical protein VGR66_03795 [Candidatus Eisenbacteria bacterium]|jgi:hypothetical protein|nr:hypothetical protein [Candidatus Eisenbacteria bacterium]